jgi:hypothetical protein
MGNKGAKHDFKPPVPFIPENEKETAQGEKPVAVKLQHDDNRLAIPNPTTEYLPLFYQGTIEQYFKWVQTLSSVMIGHAVQKRYAVALKALKGMDKDLWQRELNTAIIVLPISKQVSIV